MQRIKDAAAESWPASGSPSPASPGRPRITAATSSTSASASGGYEVFAVNPNADEVEGDRCYHHLSEIPGGVDGVVIGTRPERAENTMRECADLGIKHVWMHRGPGHGSVSEKRRTTAASTASRSSTAAARHVRADRRSGPQGDADGPYPHRQRPAKGLTQRERRRPEPAAAPRLTHRARAPARPRSARPTATRTAARRPGRRSRVLSASTPCPSGGISSHSASIMLGQAAHRGSTAVRSATSAVAPTSTAASIAAGHRKTSPRK